ncbi:hypothetical protein [Bacillus sp. EAC]|uniref:hypothetical protein n=1 Tax=Bacillus sp. EAC TaxID=1978338 RepID=UPI000B43C095|nr:hypothetical protein [Bacillus sp. EAC]
MGEQFIPRKERHKKRLLFRKHHDHVEQEKIKGSNGFFSIFYYFLLFLLFNLVQFFVFQTYDQPFNSLGNIEIIRLILSAIIYFLCILCIQDVFRKYKIPSKFLRIMIPVILYILSMITMYTIIDIYF